jgi:hypothetical protein
MLKWIGCFEKKLTSFLCLLSLDKNKPFRIYYNTLEVVAGKC